VRVLAYITHCRYVALLGLGLGVLAALAACQSQPESAGSQVPTAHPPVGHFSGTLTAPGRPELRASFEVRHPRPGHYDAELVVDTEPGLSFVADTLAFAAKRLLIKRPGVPGQTLALTQQGDFWRGSLTVDSTAYATLLVRRGGSCVSDGCHGWHFPGLGRCTGPARVHRAAAARRR
jgi:hypothetical protein